jgi:biotin operon repressor
MGWFNRVREIDELSENLNLRRKDIENKMNSLRQRGKPFAI